MRTGAAAFVGRLEHHAAVGDDVRRQGAGHSLLQCRDQPFHRVRGLERGQRLAVELLVGVLSEPLPALGRALLQQGFQIHGDGRAAALLRLEGDAAAVGLLQPVAHDRLVHAADVLDVQVGVGEAFAGDNEEVAEHAEDHAVRHERGNELHAGFALVAAGTAFEEGETVRVEEVPVPLREAERAVPAAIVHEAEQGDELGPRTVAVIHRVRVAAGVGVASRRPAWWRSIRSASSGFRESPASSSIHRSRVRSVLSRHGRRVVRRRSRIARVIFESMA